MDSASSVKLVLKAFVVLAGLISLPLCANPVKSSVWIEVRRPGGVRFGGTVLPRNGVGMGVVTPSGEIATAAHVVWQAKSINVADADGGIRVAHIVSIDPKVDLALLAVDRRFENAASLRAKPAINTEAVRVVQRDGAESAPVILTGRIGSTRWTSNGVAVPLIYSDIRGEKGMSGGALFDAAGQVIGIVIRIDRTLGYLSAVPAAELCKRFSRCAAKPAESH